MVKYIDAEALKRDLIDNRSFFPAIVARAIEEAPACDVVSMGVLAQVQWERDVAIEQLNSYGVGFAEKADVVRVVRCKDCYKRATEDCPMDDGWTSSNIFCSYGERKA